jgi:8-oxo-dGTP diphosphatase
VAVDCIIFAYDVIEKELSLLLIKRDFEPAMGMWSLPGGFVNEDEDMEDAARRILYNLTGLKDVFLEQSYTYGNVTRDPGARVISTAYFALIKHQEINGELKNEHGAHWQPVSKIPDLIFDHNDMVKKALTELQCQVKVKPVGFELLPETFTLVQFQDLYEAIYRRIMDKRNFRRKILAMNLLEKLDEKDKINSKRGAFYYRFIPDKYSEFTRNGFYFDLDVN